MKVIVAEVPWFTVNGVVLNLTLVLLYKAEPLPIEVIDKVNCLTLLPTSIISLNSFQYSAAMYAALLPAGT